MYKLLDYIYNFCIKYLRYKDKESIILYSMSISLYLIYDDSCFDDKSIDRNLVIFLSKIIKELLKIDKSTIVKINRSYVKEFFTNVSKKSYK